MMAFCTLKANGFSVNTSLGLGLFVIYLLMFYFRSSHKKGGNPVKWIQHHWVWRYIAKQFNATISLEEPLDHNKQYIFCQFPHGTHTFCHLFTMTDGCEMLSKHYQGEQRDLAASILFCFPIWREFIISLGCVDASSATARYNLERGRSLLIFVGGEKEQLMTEPHHNRIYLKSRKGFIKLALEHGVDLIPMYVFGENELYTVSKLFMGPRIWLQKKFQIGMPIAWGLWGTQLPHFVPIRIEVSKPIPVCKKDSISQSDIDELHSLFMKEMTRLFDRTKHLYYDNSDKITLEIL